jgi:transcriptional regulator NrdR family protein
MKCPVCNAWVEVQETRQRKEGRYRRYQCGNLHTFGTMESLFVIYDEEFKRQNKEARIARLHASKKKEAA